MQHQRYWIALGALLTGLLVWLAFVWEPDVGTKDSTSQTHGLQQQAAKPSGGDFTLDSPDGRISLKDYRGKVVLVYFGYTFCPDVCPTSLSAMGQALAALSPEELAQVKGIFVSVDPERDTRDILKVYAPFFHANITGATGTPEQLAEIARRYSVSYMKQKAVDERPYTVDHTSLTYLIARDGTLAATLQHGAPVQDIVAGIRQQLAGTTRN